MKITPTPEEETNPKYPADCKSLGKIRKAQTTGGMMPESSRTKRPQRLGGMAIDSDIPEECCPKKKKRHPSEG